MRLKVIPSDDSITHVALSGRLDLTAVMDVQYEFLQQTTMQPKPTLVDLSQVTFLGSMGMGMLLGAAKHLQVRNFKMVLWNPSALVRATLETAGVHKVIPIANEQTAAEGLLR